LGSSADALLFSLRRTLLAAFEMSELKSEDVDHERVSLRRTLCDLVTVA
jgi:hypothetical protein